MHIILTGATGLVGSAALDALILNRSINRVTVLSRKPVPQANSHEKVKVILHQDFSSFPSPISTQSLADELKDANGCIWALGVSQKDVGREEYISITKGYSDTFIRYLDSIIPPSSSCTFVYVSSYGATHTPGTFTPLFRKVKGEAEQSLLAYSNDNSRKGRLPVYIAQPGAVDPSKHDELLAFGRTPANPLLSKMILFPLYSIVSPSLITPSRELGQSLVQLAMKRGEPMQGKGVDGNGYIVNNIGLLHMNSHDSVM